jgi:hypothetical protein
MYPIALPNHNSDCPLCEDTQRQMAWVIGSNKLNQIILRGSAVIDNILLESSYHIALVAILGISTPHHQGTFSKDSMKKAGVEGRYALTRPNYQN